MKASPSQSRFSSSSLPQPRNAHCSSSAAQAALAARKMPMLPSLILPFTTLSTLLFKRTVEIEGHGVGGAAVDRGEAAVAADRPGPPGAPLPQQRAVVLGAADHQLAVERVQGEAVELRGGELGVVVARPGLASVGRLEDAAIVADIDDGGIGRGGADARGSRG